LYVSFILVSCISCLNKQNTEIYCFINITIPEINLMVDVTPEGHDPT
jgi:hypothetical protein